MEKTGAGKVHESGFALTLGLSVLVHAAVLGTVSVFAFQGRLGPAETASPGLEVIWVSTAEPAGEKADGATRGRGDAGKDGTGASEHGSMGEKADGATRGRGGAGKDGIGASEHVGVGEKTDTQTMGTAPAKAEALGPEPMVGMSSEPATEPAALEPGPGPVAPPAAGETMIAALAAGEEGRDAGFAQGPDASKSGGEVGDPSSTPPPLQLSSPEYPTLSRRLGEEGTVLLAMRFGPDGQVSEARVERSSGFARLDGAALAAARAERLNREASIRLSEGFVKVAYTFTLEDR